MDCIGDLVDENYINNGFITKKYLVGPKTGFQKEIREKKNGKGYLKKGEELTEQEYSRHRPDTIAKFKHMIDKGGEYPDGYKSKKFSFPATTFQDFTISWILTSTTFSATHRPWKMKKIRFFSHFAQGISSKKLT